MKDISLDDLIKQDKEKAKTKFKTKGNQNKKFIRRPLRNKPDNRNRLNRGGTPKFQRSQPFNNNGQRSRGRFDRNEQPVFRLKRRPLNKSQNREENKSPEGNTEKGRTLKVLGLHPQFSNEDLYKLFSAEGALQKCLREHDDFGRELPTALVKYHGAESARSAIEKLNNKTIMNSVLTVEPYRRRK